MTRQRWCARKRIGPGTEVIAPGARVIGPALILCAVLAGLLPIRLESRTPPTTADPEVKRFIELLNDYRVSIGCEALILDMRLTGVAEAHSEDMARRRFFSHTNPDGASYIDRIRRAGIPFSSAAENIAQTEEGARGVLDQWLASSGHRANIRNCGFTHHGVGRHENRWTHLFVRQS